MLIIQNFAASLPGVPVGGAITLSWATANATSVTLDGPGGPVTISGASGSVDVTLNSAGDSSYTLTATSSAGSITSSLTVRGFQISSAFPVTASSTDIVQGDSVVLMWNRAAMAPGYTMQNARIVAGSFTHQVQDSDPAYLAVTPSTTTGYQFIADLFLSVFDDETGGSKLIPTAAPYTLYFPVIQVDPAPAPTVSLAATPTTLANGQNTTLVWSVIGAATASIAATITDTSGTPPTPPTVGTVGRHGSALVPIAASTTFTLTSSNAAGSSSKSAAILVVGPPQITFTLAPTTIGGSAPGVILTWSVTGSTSVSIDNGVGSVPPVGTRTLGLSHFGPTVFTLTATNGYATATASPTVDPLPIISVLSASPATAPLDNHALLHWVTSGAQAGGVRIDPNIGVVADTGTVADQQPPNGPQTYTITATNTAGSVQQTVVYTPLPLTITTATIDAAREQDLFFFQMAATHGDGTYVWSVAAGSLPDGLSLSASGAITGTPSKYGYWTVTIQVTSEGLIAQKDYEIMVKLATWRLDPFHKIFYRVLDPDGDPVAGLTNDNFPDGTKSIFGTLVVGAAVGTNEFTLTDTRKRGGGLAPAYQTIPAANHFWDVGYWDGKPYPLGGALVVYLPASLLQPNGPFTRQDVEAKVMAIVPMGVLPVIRYMNASGEEML